VATNPEKLRSLLEELFQLDQADLDFGIYRIMNAKRAEIVRFLDKDLLPQVKAAFKHYKSADKSVLQGELDKLIATITNAGMNPDESPKVKELRQRLNDSAVDVTALENEVFSHLTNFFRRYYNEGDFISQRRYKEGVYAIPYEGEEVKLHWANADQYYVKSSEYFKDYTFTMASGKRVRVHLTAATTEQDNNKAAPGKERRFVLCEDTPVYEENGELFIRFEYRPAEGKEKQDALNQAAIERILKTKGFDEWTRELSKPAPTEKDGDRTVLEKHLHDYTNKNTFDYFIHKDLGGFLRRELDFFIKNEVMHLDDIEHESAPRVEQYLSQIKVIRTIAHKIIAFLEQLENFQKKLWLKKKFVIETNYCITLDRVPEELYAEIAKNDAQREEWVRLFAIDEIKKDLSSPGYSKPLKVDFLKANPFLVLDTAFFPLELRNRVLSQVENIDSNLDGILVHADNAHGLRLMEPVFKSKIECVHIDPPYNTQTSGFLYKNSYEHSSWLAMMDERATLGSRFLSDGGSFLCHIDENEYERLQLVFDRLGVPNGGTIVWDKRNPMLGRKGVATQHEYVIWRTNVEGALYLRNANQRMILEKAKELTQQYAGDTKKINEQFGKWISACPGLSGGERAYRLIDDDGRVYQSVAIGAPEPRTDPKFFEPLYHPRTKKPCPVPKWGWARAPETMNELLENGAIIFGLDETVQPRAKVYLTEDSQRQVSSVIQDASRGKADTDKFGIVFPYSHPVSLYVSLVGAAAPSRHAVVLDFFAGSGTNAHAVIALNRDEGTNRRYVMVEAGKHFDAVMKPRILKAVYSSEWKEGKPLGRDGVSQFVKYIRLESYEDVLNNLEMKRTNQQGTLLDADAELREQYTLSYMLDVESRRSQSLLNVEGFRNPDQYKLRVERNGEFQLVNVDLVETFNWLLGLTVKHIDVIRGVRVVDGTSPNGERILILWRNQDELDGDKLDKWFEKQGYSTRDLEFDVIYVNGDNNLENLCRTDQAWKVRLIEEEFHRLMFDVQDV
jgi:adenine-specific DNA-methyltransferase